ncbi:hypothetical protein [Halomonas lysinitropha]|nr:hypothetical protein [Halomonas lysinitropha]
MFTRRTKKSIAVITLLGVSLPLVAAADSHTKQRIAVERADSQIRQRSPAEVERLPAEANRLRVPAGSGAAVDFDRCANVITLSNSNERYHWIQMDMDVSQRFYNDAINAGYSVSGPANQMYSQIPASFVQQQETQYCNNYIDPAGFPHHISKNRTCSLSLHPVATLKYSGCYLKSSTRKRNIFGHQSQELNRLP